MFMMADSNDDLLEDGDLSETNFEELDLAEEDALLADDNDERPLKITHNEGEKEDDDYLELGVDEDLTLNDEEVIENGNLAKKKRVPIELDFNNENDDSDDNSGGERTRFKSERQIITSSTRNSSSIPETLDAVAVRNPVKFNKVGNRGGKGGRGGGGNNRKFGRNQPTNIHVNPHFRPRVPFGGPQMWNGGFHGQPQPPFPPPHSYGYQPPAQSQWNEPGYFGPPGGPPPYNQPPGDPNYYGPPHESFYQPMQPNYPPPPPPGSQMGWADPNYYGGGPPQGFMPPPPPFQSGPPMGPPRMRPPFNHGPRPPFHKNQNKPFNAKNQQGHHGWSGGIRPQKREQFQVYPSKTPPVKQQKFDNNPAARVRSNLQEVRMVDCLPPEALAEEEDEEMKAYRKKIEEQKKLREQLLKEKEEKRLVAAQQKLQESARLGSKVATPTIATPHPPGDGPPGVTDVEYKMVRVRTPGGKTIVKKMTLIEIQKLKKVPVAAKAPVNPSIGNPSRIVVVENLSASTTQKQLEEMANRVGAVEKVELDSDKKTAIIRFLRLDSARDFVSKYQRKMIDLSMIGLKFIKQE